jgi:hypothetical protein
MNQPIMQAIAFALGCILALQSASPAFAQNAATGPNDDLQQPVASTPAATSSPAAQASGSATSGGSQETSPYPEAPTPQTLDVKESLRVKQTKEAAKKQDPIRDASQRPQGAAAAGAYTTGVAAYQPAGAAIAPAKQRRSRSFLIRLGILAGAGIAVGSVVALSAASPSKPPGSR